MNLLNLVNLMILLVILVNMVNLEKVAGMQGPGCACLCDTRHVKIGLEFCEAEFTIQKLKSMGDHQCRIGCKVSGREHWL